MPLIEFVFGPEPARWQTDLLRRCRAAGFPVVTARAPGPSAPAGLRLLLSFERLAYRLSPCAYDLTEVERTDAGAADLTIDLSGGREGLIRSWPLMRPLYQGSADPGAVVAALLARQTPRVALEWVDMQGARVVVEGDLAILDPAVLSRALDETFARLASMILRAVENFRAGFAFPALAASAAPPLAAVSPLAFGAGAVAEKIGARLRKLVVQPEHWRVALRRLDGAGVIDDLAWPQATYQALADDGQRYYADPFLFEHEGRTHLFVEEYPYATAKGIISHCLVGADGRASAPRPVLEADCHLSYPQVFAHAGAIYMIPETGGARRIELYRAERFPDRWRLDAVLVDNVEASDATLMVDAGRFWLFAALSDGGASSWDALGLFSAADLRGPWRAHQRNPVVIDARGARPAGPMVKVGGKWRRPTQNCAAGYGAAMRIYQVELLDDEQFSQSLLADLAPPAQLGAQGVHTLCRLGPIEAIDFHAPLARKGFGWLR